MNVNYANDGLLKTAEANLNNISNQAARVFNEIDPKRDVERNAPTIAKVLLIGGSVLSCLSNPIVAIVGFGAGLFFSREVKDISDRAVECFKGSSLGGKAFGLTSLLALMLFASIGVMGVGVYLGGRCREIIAESARQG